eukprot:4087383-Amphidinium_carterae.1
MSGKQSFITLRAFKLEPCHAPRDLQHAGCWKWGVQGRLVVMVHGFSRVLVAAALEGLGFVLVFASGAHAWRFRV